jgi:glutamate--cysteine ligase
MGIGFLGIGFQPKWALSDIPIMPKVIFSFKLGYLNFAVVLNC